MPTTVVYEVSAASLRGAKFGALEGATHVHCCHFRPPALPASLIGVESRILTGRMRGLGLVCPVKKWTKIAVGAVVMLVLIGAALWGSWASREPMYKGRSLTDYFDYGEYLVTSGPGPEAMKYFGTNSIPYVRAALRVRPTWGRTALVWIRLKAPWLGLRVRGADVEVLGAEAAYDSIVDAGCWGDAKAVCAPELRALMSYPGAGYRANGVRQVATNILAKLHTTSPP